MCTGFEEAAAAAAAAVAAGDIGATAAAPLAATALPVGTDIAASAAIPMTAAEFGSAALPEAAGLGAIGADAAGAGLLGAGALGDIADIAGASGAANPLSIGLGNLWSLYGQPAAAGLGKAQSVVGPAQSAMNLMGMGQHPQAPPAQRPPSMMNPMPPMSSSQILGGGGINPGGVSPQAAAMIGGRPGQFSGIPPALLQALLQRMGY